MMAGLREALMPRTAAARASGAPWYSPKVGLASILDQASLPGRAYVSLGRPDGESYLDALGRTEPRYDIAGYQGEGDELAETLLRDPSLPLGAVGGMVRGLGRVGRAVADAGIGAATGGADQYAQGRRVSLGDLIGSAALGAVPSVAMGGKAPVSRMAGEITPEQRAANFKNWFGGSKVVDEAGNPLVVYHGSSLMSGDAFNDALLGSNTGAKSANSGFFFARNPETANTYATEFGVSPMDTELKFDAIKKKDYPAGMVIDDKKTSENIENYVNQKLDEWENKNPKPTDDDLIGDWEESQMNMYNKLYIDLRASGKEAELYKWKPGGSPSVTPAYVSLKNPIIHDYGGKPIRDVPFSWLLEDAIDNGNDGAIFRNAIDNIDGGHTISDIVVAFEPTQIKSATGNRGTFDPNDPNITHFTGRSAAPTITTRASNRIKQGAAEASLRDYLSDGRKEQVGGPVRTGLGGFLLASPGDTPYTRRTR